MTKNKKVGVILKMEMNQLANLFYRMMGYNAKDGYDFSKANHPTEKMIWQMAQVSFEFWSHKRLKND